MLDLSHEIDLVNHLVGPGRCVGAIIDGPRVLELAADVDESAVLVTDHGGVRATIRVSFARRPESRLLRVFGRNGTLEWDAVARAARHVDNDGTLVAAVSWVDGSAMYVEQAKAWLAVLGGESGGLLATGQDGLQALRIIDDARATHWNPHRPVETVCAS
jgi:predicted dehydrogenase